MDRIFQVFVSSTYSDLQEERRAVSDTLAKAGFIPAGMELFPATDQQQLEFIKRVIDRCDYYVVIVGGRYGSLASDNVSYTEKEYEYALERRIPVLAFLPKYPDRILAGKTDVDAEQRARLERFRIRLATGRLVDFWTSPEDLCTRVLTALMQAVTLFPGNGWIRGDQAVDPKVLQELERLRIENSDIRKQLLESQSSELTFPADVPGPEEPFDYVVSVRRYERKKGSTGVSLEREDELVGSISLGSIFVNLYDAVLVQSFEGELEGETGSVIAALLGRSDPNKKFELYPDYVRKMRVRLEALGLIRTETKKIPGPIPTLDSQGIVWSLTDKGRQYITRSLAGVSKA